MFFYFIILSLHCCLIRLLTITLCRFQLLIWYIISRYIYFAMESVMKKAMCNKLTTKNVTT